MFEDFIPKSKFIRNLIYFIGDIFIIYIAAVFSLLLRFEFILDVQFYKFYQDLIQILPFTFVTTIIVFIVFRFYSTMWSVASLREAALIFISCTLAGIVQILSIIFLHIQLPRSYYILFIFFLYAFEMIWRFFYRIFRSLTPHKNKNYKRIMIIGAGEAGAQILREIRNSTHMSGKVICFIDDSDYKIGKNLNGIKIYGDRNKIIELSKKFNIDEIYIAMPAASTKVRKEIINICSQTKCQVKTLPGIYQIANGEVSISKLREIDIEDLLGRDEVKVNLNEILDSIKGKTILVTGAGGSIGSEICRQLASHNPKMLILLDIYENSIYDLQNELKTHFPNLIFITLIASVRDEKRIDSIFNEYKPDIIYHAAAHKHVPLMEDSPCEAIKNNCFGTYNMINAADKYNSKKFILISTDKAVNPTNVMGASKRICEMLMQYKARHSKTTFSLVRFGNVLGSNGSVIPLFKKQIEDGGPVTVTHPDIIRYFMTIPEAVSLVLQAGAYAKGGEIFILDMGSPVKILDMAEKLIRLAGYEPNVDINIEFTGLRPGEKLFEELLLKEEGLKSTNNKLIFIGNPINFDDNVFLNQIIDLKEKCNKNDNNIKEKIKEIVSTYTN
ncbi:MAG: nucleoside-diphosphate sugar epimerase/dehydratase [Eubacteriales bacterium]|nr:nucleoside-diphosphate sugar epimerase/dehydratase [Eubacteriales bacterium]